MGVLYINTSAWVLRCSFNCIGQCESLKLWNERHARSPRFYCIVICPVIFFIHADVWRSRRQNNLQCNMEKKIQNEELQSRREFFKKAAKGVLPILGAVALASAPAIVKATQATSCVDNCYAACMTGCVTTCKGYCKIQCADSCYSNCSHSCSAICRNTSR